MVIQTVPVPGHPGMCKGLPVCGDKVKQKPRPAEEPYSTTAIVTITNATAPKEVWWEGHKIVMEVTGGATPKKRITVDGRIVWEESIVAWVEHKP
jgi:hypothetical protein